MLPHRRFLAAMALFWLIFGLGTTFYPRMMQLFMTPAGDQRVDAVLGSGVAARGPRHPVGVSASLRALEIAGDKNDHASRSHRRCDARTRGGLHARDDGPSGRRSFSSRASRASRSPCTVSYSRIGCPNRWLERVHGRIRMTGATHPPDLVIRPSGVWDTRAPFHSFLREHRRERDLHSLMLSIGRVSSDAAAEEPTASAKVVFRPKKSGLDSALSWKSYKYGWRTAGNEGDPTAKDVRRCLRLATTAITEQAIVSLCGYFETFCQCWALNMLLVRLEAGTQWSKAERRLAEQFWPIGQSRFLPTFHKISAAFPVIDRESRSCRMCSPTSVREWR